MFLSTPLTVMAMVILAQFDGTRWIAVLLSADGEPQKLNRQTERAGRTRRPRPDERPLRNGATKTKPADLGLKT